MMRDSRGSDSFGAAGGAFVVVLKRVLKGRGSWRWWRFWQRWYTYLPSS